MFPEEVFLDIEFRSLELPTWLESSLFARGNPPNGTDSGGSSSFVVLAKKFTGAVEPSDAGVIEGVRSKEFGILDSTSEP